MNNESFVEGRTFVLIDSDDHSDPGKSLFIYIFSIIVNLSTIFNII